MYEVWSPKVRSWVGKGTKYGRQKYEVKNAVWQTVFRQKIGGRSVIERIGW